MNVSRDTRGPLPLLPPRVLRVLRTEVAGSPPEEGRRREELVKGGTTTSITSATRDLLPQKPTPTEIAAQALREGARAGEGLLCNTPCEEGAAGEEIVDLREQNGV